MISHIACFTNIVPALLNTQSVRGCFLDPLQFTPHRSMHFTYITHRYTESDLIIILLTCHYSARNYAQLMLTSSLRPAYINLFSTESSTESSFSTQLRLQGLVDGGYRGTSLVCNHLHVNVCF